MFISFVFLILAWLNYAEGNIGISITCATIALLGALVIDKGQK